MVINKFIKVLLAQIFLLTFLYADSTKPFFTESCKDFAYSGVIEDMAIDYLKYAKAIILKDTKFIEVTKFDSYLYGIAFSKCFSETLNGLSDKMKNSLFGEALNEFQLPFDFLTGTASNTPSKTVKVTSEPDMPFMTLLFNMFKDSATYVGEHLIKCTFQKYHNYQDFIANHLNNSFKVELNTFNYISKLCNYQLVRENEEYNPFLVRERDKLVGHIVNTEKTINSILNDPHPLDKLKNLILSKKATSINSTDEVNNTNEINHLSEGMANALIRGASDVTASFDDIIAMASFRPYILSYKLNYATIEQGKEVILNTDIDLIFNTDTLKNAYGMSDVYKNFIYYLDYYYSNIFSYSFIKDINYLFEKNYHIEKKILIENNDNTDSTQSLMLNTQQYNIDLLIKTLLYQDLTYIDKTTNKKIPVTANLKRILILYAYINNYIQNDDLLSKQVIYYITNHFDSSYYKEYYLLYYSLLDNLKAQIIKYFWSKLTKILSNYNIKQFNLLDNQDVQNYQINLILKDINEILKSIDDLSKTNISEVKSSNLKHTFLNHTKLFMYNCALLNGDMKEKCEHYNSYFFKDFNVFAGYETNTEDILKGFVNEINNINQYENDKQFEAKINEIQVDYSKLSGE